VVVCTSFSPSTTTWLTTDRRAQAICPAVVVVVVVKKAVFKGEAYLFADHMSKHLAFPVKTARSNEFQY
jgi:hypothetical protein